MNKEFFVFMQGNLTICWKMKKFNELSVRELFDLYKLRTAIFVVEQNCPYQEVDDKDLQAVHVCGYINNDLVAYCRILPKNVSYNEVSIGRVAVDEKYRKKSYGKQLMQQAISYINQEMGEESIRISAQTYLKRFYEELGFFQQKEEYLEDGIPHIEMLKVK